MCCQLSEKNTIDSNERDIECAENAQQGTLLTLAFVTQWHASGSWIVRSLCLHTSLLYLFKQPFIKDKSYKLESKKQTCKHAHKCYMAVLITWISQIQLEIWASIVNYSILWKYYWKYPINKRSFYQVIYKRLCCNGCWRRLWTKYPNNVIAVSLYLHVRVITNLFSKHLH